jgi:DNA invertase Pin-like site-specific DNA recombinase
MLAKIARFNCRNVVELEVIGCYSDMGKSGMRWERPGLQALLSDVRKRIIDAVFVTDPMRLSRDGFHLEKIENILKRHGCAFFFLDPPGGFLPKFTD